MVLPATRPIAGLELSACFRKLLGLVGSPWLSRSPSRLQALKPQTAPVSHQSGLQCKQCPPSLLGKGIVCCACLASGIRCLLQQSAHAHPGANGKGTYAVIWQAGYGLIGMHVRAGHGDARAVRDQSDVTSSSSCCAPFCLPVSCEAPGPHRIHSALCSTRHYSSGQQGLPLCDWGHTCTLSSVHRTTLDICCY